MTSLWELREEPKYPFFTSNQVPSPCTSSWSFFRFRFCLFIKWQKKKVPSSSLRELRVARGRIFFFASKSKYLLHIFPFQKFDHAYAIEEHLLCSGLAVASAIFRCKTNPHFLWMSWLNTNVCHHAKMENPTACVSKTQIVALPTLSQKVGSGLISLMEHSSAHGTFC